MRANSTIPIPARQFKAVERGVTLSVEAARGAGRRHFIASLAGLSLRVPIADDVSDERVIPVMMQRLETRLMDLLDKLTAPPKH